MLFFSVEWLSKFCFMEANMKAWLRKRQQEQTEETAEQVRWMQQERSIAVAVLVVTPAGIPLVRDPRRAFALDEPQVRPVYWKLPGGKGEDRETPEEAAARELLQETGIRVSCKDLSILWRENRGSHDYIIFRADLVRIPRLASLGDEGEEVQMFSAERILQMRDFFPSQKRIIEQHLLALVVFAG
jgi:8-oxo-dGTP pyrophosphatase MutT (NUDIX family)